MQKKIIALAIAAAVSTPAFADVAADNAGTTTFSVYGVLDVAYGTVQHSLPASSTFPGSVNPVSGVKTSTNLNQVTGLFNGGISDSRIGFKGTEDLGNGMKAFFVLETGFNAPTGQINNAAASLANGANEANANSSLSGQLFNRQAFVGISDETLGSIAVGRNYNPIVDVLVKYDPVQYAQLFSPLGFSGTLGGGGGISEDSRVDNSIKYTNKFGSVNVSALYKAGGAAVNGNGGATAINVGYEAGDFGVQAVYEQFVNALQTGTATIGTLAASNYNTTAYLLAAKYKMGDATLKAGYEHYVKSAASDAAATSQMVFGYSTTVTNQTGNDVPTDVLYVGGDYNLTPTTNISAGVYNVHNFAVAKAAGTTLSQTSSDANYLSILVDHSITKSTDVYAGYMYATFSGDAYVGANAAFDNNISAVGIRHKF